MVVLTNPVSADLETEFNRWYDEVHLKEVCQIPGFVGGERFRIRSDIEVLPGMDPPAQRYLAIYELDAPDLGEAVGRLQAALPELDMSESLDIASAGGFVAEVV